MPRCFFFCRFGFRTQGCIDAAGGHGAASAGSYLLVVGHDKNLEKYRARAQRLGLGSRVRFAGRQADVKPFLRRGRWPGAADAL